MSTGRRVIVTGGAAGIGAAVVGRLLDAGNRVAVFDRDPVGAPAEAGTYRVDVRDSAAIESAVATISREWGGIDGLVNNAGIGTRGSVMHATDDDWLTVLDTNVVGTARMSRAVIPFMASSSAPRIVNISSVSAVTGVQGRAVYSASKGAIQSLTRAMAADHVSAGILVNCVLPGTTETSWVRRLIDAGPDPAQAHRDFASRQPTGRMVTAADVAATVALLLDPACGSVTGESFVVDGGMSALRLGV